MTLPELHAWATMGKTSIAMDKEAWDNRGPLPFPSLCHPLSFWVGRILNSWSGRPESLLASTLGRTATRAAARALKEKNRDEKYTSSKFSRYGVGSKKVPPPFFILSQSLKFCLFTHCP